MNAEDLVAEPSLPVDDDRRRRPLHGVRPHRLRDRITLGARFVHSDRKSNPVLVQECPERRKAHGFVVLEDRMEPDDGYRGTGEVLRDPLSLRQSASNAARAEHLEGVEQDDSPSKAFESERLDGVEPGRRMPFGGGCGFHGFKVMATASCQPILPRFGTGAALACLLALAGCDQARELVDSRTPRERYLDGLYRAGLGDNALARDWLAAGAQALTDPPTVTSPHHEEVSLPTSDPAAIGLRIELRRGQLARFDVGLPGDTATAIFLDVWLAEGARDSAARAVAESKRGERWVAFEPRADGWYIFRAQPELLRGGRFSVSLAVAPTLAFPVSGYGERAIMSRWGAPRDGGRRRHEGIDIFAPRGTPVIAGAGGEVAEVGENELGGLVVWLRDEFGNTQYFAHLLSQRVVEGQVVVQGDTIGLVGNTGNARTTPPHLHFGIYRRGEGAVDPYWFVHRSGKSIPRLAVDTTLLGGFARVRVVSAVARRAPFQRADTLRRLNRADSVRVLGATGGWFRVQLGDGSQGFLAAGSAERISEPERPGTRGTGVVSAP